MDDAEPLVPPSSRCEPFPAPSDSESHLPPVSAGLLTTVRVTWPLFSSPDKPLPPLLFLLLQELELLLELVATGRLRKMEGEKERLLECWGDLLWTEVGERNPESRVVGSASSVP